MRVAIKKKIASLLVFIMIFTSFVPVYAAPSKNKSKSDIEGHWAETDLLAMASNGVMGGYPDGSMKPNRYVTIAETVKIINKAFNIVGAGDVYSIPYTDVQPYAWYSADIALAVENGYLLSIAPGKRLKPNAPATREQIGAMFAQVMGLESKTLDPVSKFSDSGKITQGYNYYFAAAVKEGLFAGYPDNTLKPQATVTRGIMAAVSNRAMSQSQTTELHKIFVGPNDILIETAGTTISNRIVDNVWVAASVGEGTVTLDNVKVRGKLVIKGGGPNSVIVKGESDVPLVYMEKETRDLRLKVEKPAIVGTVNVNAGSKNYITGDIETLIPNVKRGEVRVDKAKIKTIEVKGEDTDLYVEKDAEVTNLTVNRSAANTFMLLDGKITSVVISAPLTKAQVYGTINNIYLTSTARASEIIAEKSAHITTVKTDADRVSIRGTGKVDNAIINGNDCKIDTVPTKVEVDKGASGTTSNGKPIPGGSTGTTKPGGGIDGGAVGPNDPNAKVTTMEITKYPPSEKLVYTVGDTLNLDGLEVTFSYSNGATASVPLKDFSTNSISITPNPDGKTKVLASTKSVKITHLPTNKTATLNLTVSGIPKVKELMITKSPKNKYIDGATLDLTGMEVLLSYDNEVTKTVKFEKTKVTTPTGTTVDSDSFRDIGLETSLQNGSLLTLKRPGTVAETRSMEISFRNPDNQLVKAKSPLTIMIDPTNRIDDIQIISNKATYKFGDTFDFNYLVIKLKHKDPTDKPDITLKYDTVKNEFVYAQAYTESGKTYNVGDLYKAKADNGDVLKEVKITEQVKGVDILVTHGADVGLGGTNNKKILKVSHVEKDIAPVSVETTVDIKPPSNAVTARIDNLGGSFKEGDSVKAALESWNIVVIRDAIVQEEGKPTSQEEVRVLFGNKTSSTTAGVQLYEYISRTNEDTWTPYNYDSGGRIRNMEIKVVKEKGSNSGTDIVTNPNYQWSKLDKQIVIFHKETGYKLSPTGLPVPETFERELARFDINVEQTSGIKVFEIAVHPTEEGPFKTPITYYVGTENILDEISGRIVIRYQVAGGQDRFFKYQGRNWIEVDADFVTPKNPQSIPEDVTKIKLNVVTSGGIVLEPGSIIPEYDRAVIRLTITDSGKEIVANTKPLTVKIRIKAEHVDIAGLAPTPTQSLPSAATGERIVVNRINWGSSQGANAEYSKTYTADVTISPKSGYAFDVTNIIANKTAVQIVTNEYIEGAPVVESIVKEIDVLGKETGNLIVKVKFTMKAAPVAGASVPAPIAPTTKTLAAPTVSTSSYTEPASAKSVSTLDSFKAAASNPTITAVKITEDTAFSESITIDKPVIVESGVTLSFNADPPASGRSTGVDKNFKTTRQFRITGKGVLYIKSGAVLNKVGKGDFRVDNGGRVIVEGTLSNKGKKWIGKEGTTLKTYGKSAIVITGSMAGPVMTIEGNADLLQSLTLDKNLVVSQNGTLNVKNSATLTANDNITINNKGNINVNENSIISGTGKYVGESPMGNYFAGFIMESEETVRYGSKKTNLTQTQSGSNIRLSFRVPKEASRVYLYDTYINAGDVRPGVYALQGKDTLNSVIIEVAKPSSSTGLSKVNFGYKSKGIVIPKSISPGRYTVSGIIGGANVTLDIYID